MSEEIVLSDRNVPRQPLEDELTRLYSQGFLTDITLSTEDGKNFEAHRILLAARSQYFHSIVPRLKAEPVIFLKGIKGAHLDKILKFMYGTRVAVSKHQLKPILEVAKNLQVKGLQDVSASEVLSRQSVVSAGRFKPDSPLASPILAASKLAQSRQMQSTFDKTTLATFKSPMGRRGRTMMNGSPTPSDSEEPRGGGGGQESDDESGPRTRKGRRGRPPKKDKTVSKDKGKGDPYEFEEDDDKNEASQSGDEQDSNKRGWRYQSDRKRKGEEEGDGSERTGSPSQDEESGSAKKKRTISVKCKGNLADLYPTRFVSGVRGQCIKFKDQLMTPQEFEVACGGSGKKYLENIKTDYGPLKTLTASGMLRQLQGRAGRSESPPSRSPSKSSKRQRDNEEEGNEEDDEDGEEEEDTEERQEETNEEEEAEEEEDEEEEVESEVMQQQEMVEEQEKDTQTDGLIIRGKKKKKKHRDDWKKHLTTHLKTEVIMHNEHQPHHLQPIMFSGSNDPLGLMTSMPQPTFAAPNIMDQPPKISPANLIHEHHQQQQQTQTLYVMSPHPSMTPQHHAFAPPMSPMPHSPPTPIPSFSMPVVSNAQPTFAKPLTPIPSTQSQMSRMGMSGMGSSRIGNILNVRCKSTTAILVASKYESGSKGKCIQLGDEWLTPNEFEDRAGSKAKKYLSSIKCMGRPLRVYVNSGELRGANPPPQPKSKQKQLKQMPHSHQQAIAPAPLQGPSLTPTHISNAPSMPHGLIMSGNQTPILFNQTSMASSMIGNQPINLPMTFALASPLEVRQNVSQPM